MIDKIKVPSPSEKLTIFSDGNDDYATVIPEYYSIVCIDYGQKVKTQNGEKVFPPIKKIVYGSPKTEDIETNAVESINSILRGKLSRFHRKTKMISKKKVGLDFAINLFGFFWNFIHKRHKHLLTPAMMEGISKKRWSWGMFLHAKLTDVN